MVSLSAEATAFLTERYNKELHYFTVYDSYAPDLKKSLITSKFYSKYEGPCSDDADSVLVEKIKKAKWDIPRERYPDPLTENQCYGWFVEPLVEVDRNDNRFYHPRTVVDFVKHDLRLKLDESALPKTKFTGIPFKCQ